MISFRICLVDLNLAWPCLDFGLDLNNIYDVLIDFDGGTTRHSQNTSHPRFVPTERLDRLGGRRVAGGWHLTNLLRAPATLAES
ncbi:hypothetical protein HYQ44_012548 [Verticillium longisporum]|nr:hypothetical protein HYQ44_012548 [Verticillium longisporum]